MSICMAQKRKTSNTLYLAVTAVKMTSSYAFCASHIGQTKYRRLVENHMRPHEDASKSETKPISRSSPTPRKVILAGLATRSRICSSNGRRQSTISQHEWHSVMRNSVEPKSCRFSNRLMLIWYLLFHTRDTNAKWALTYYYYYYYRVLRAICCQPVDGNLICFM